MNEVTPALFARAPDAHAMAKLKVCWGGGPKQAGGPPPQSAWRRTPDVMTPRHVAWSEPCHVLRRAPSSSLKRASAPTCLSVCVSVEAS